MSRQAHGSCIGNSNRRVVRKVGRIGRCSALPCIPLGYCLMFQNISDSPFFSMQSTADGNLANKYKQNISIIWTVKEYAGSPVLVHSKIQCRFSLLTAYAKTGDIHSWTFPTSWLTWDLGNKPLNECKHGMWLFSRESVQKFHKGTSKRKMLESHCIMCAVHRESLVNDCWLVERKYCIDTKYSPYWSWNWHQISQALAILRIDANLNFSLLLSFKNVGK